MASKSLFVIKKTRDWLGRRRYRVNLRDANDHNIVTSKPLESEEAVLQNIEATKHYAPVAKNKWRK